MKSHHSVIIIGSGPSGLTAALYTARANLAPLVIEGFEAGGQLMLTTDVENYPGFVDGILGPELMDTFRKQAQRFGSTFITEDVSEVDFDSRPFKVFVGEDLYTADSVIVSTGATAKTLGLASESRLMGRGVSTCATCDGAFFRDQPLAVVGGGDSAVEEATFLTRFASNVTMVHRRDQLRASKIMQDRALSNPKIDFEWNKVVTEVRGDEKVSALELEDSATGERKELDVAGLFVAIGHIPNTSLFEGKLELDPSGYLLVGHNLTNDWSRGSQLATRTSVEGVFGAGDVADHVYRQAVTAAGTGCMAAMDAERWLETQGH